MTNSSERARQLERITGTGAEKFWMHHPCDEPEPWGQFTNYDAIFKFAEAYSQAENERLRKALQLAVDLFGQDEEVSTPGTDAFTRKYQAEAALRQVERGSGV